MNKILLSVITTFVCLSSAFALDLPKGYISLYDLNFETEQCPYVVPAVTNYQFLGPPSGWGALTDHDLSTYKQLVYKLSFDAAAAGGKQVAIRFAVNGAAPAPIMVTLPTGVTTYSVSIPLDKYKDATTGAIGLGGTVFYNGGTHWAVVYDGTPCDAAVTVDYIALTADAPSALSTVVADNPNAIVNVYNVVGSLVRKEVKESDATKGLKSGLYIVNGHKVFVTK
jgi:hypothetical protein